MLDNGDISFNDRRVSMDLISILGNHKGYFKLKQIFRVDRKEVG